MAILNKDGEKVSAKVKAKEALIAHLQDFNLENCENYDDMKRTEPSKVQKFVDQIVEGMIKKLTPKVKEV